MVSDALLDVMLALPTLHALPGVRVGRSRPFRAHAVPFDTGSQASIIASATTGTFVLAGSAWQPKA